VYMQQRAGQQGPIRTLTAAHKINSFDVYFRQFRSSDIASGSSLRKLYAKLFKRDITRFSYVSVWVIRKINI